MGGGGSDVPKGSSRTGSAILGERQPSQGGLLAFPDTTEGRLAEASAVDRGGERGGGGRGTTMLHSDAHTGRHPSVMPTRTLQMAWMSFQLTADDLESQLAGLACAIDAVLCRLPE